MNNLMQTIIGVVEAIGADEDVEMEFIAGLTVLAMAALGFWVLNRIVHRERRWTQLEQDIAEARRQTEQVQPTR